MNKKWTTLICNGYKTYYMISSLGEVKNTMTDSCISTYMHDGHICVNICVDGKYRRHVVFMLMLESFHGKIKQPGQVIYFYNHDMRDVSLDNIAYLYPNEIVEIHTDLVFKFLNGNYVLRRNNKYIDIKYDDELWNFIVYDGKVQHYMISSYGRIYNMHTIQQLKISYNAHYRYPSVCIRFNGKQRHMTIHRMVAELFVPRKSPEFNIVNHLNENKQDFRASNLEWTTLSGNVMYSFKTGTNKNFGENAVQATITEKTAVKICEMLEDGFRTCDICRELGVHRDIVRHIRTRDTWKHVSKNYSFDNIPNLVTSTYEEAAIYDLWKHNKPYTDIKRITGRCSTTIGVIVNRCLLQNKYQDDAKEIMSLFNRGHDDKTISNIMNLRIKYVRHVISCNTIL